MTIEIELSPDAERRLVQRAAAAGKQPSELAQAIVERDVRRPTLQEISGDIYQKFLESGTTDDELGEMLETTKHKMRSEKHHGPSK